MVDLLESTCYEILCLLLESVEPALPDSDLYLVQESAVYGLTSFVEALRRRGSSVVLQPRHQLQHRLFDLAQLILMTDVGELTSLVDGFLFDLLDLCRTLQPNPTNQVVTSAEPVCLGFDSCSSNTRGNVKGAKDAEHCATSSQLTRNRGYLKISYLLEVYVRCSEAKQKMRGVWSMVESTVDEFAVHDVDRSCIALRRRLDEIVEMVSMLAVVENGTPLNRFLQPQVDDIFVALKEDTLQTPILLADYLRLLQRRLKRWLERILLRLMHCLRCSLAA